MTAAEWDASHDPEKMLTAAGTRLSERSLLLFACGAARRVWESLPAFATELVPRIEAAADLPPAERGEALRAAVEGIGGVPGATVRARFQPEHPLAAVQFVASLLRRFEQHSATGAHTLLGLAATLLWDSIRTTSPHSPHQAALLRCVAGNPFAESHFDPAWRTSNVLALAARDDAHPILADALQDAGCDDTAMLDHLRRDGPHARGCWVLDRVLRRAGSVSDRSEAAERD